MTKRISPLWGPTTIDTPLPPPLKRKHTQTGAEAFCVWVKNELKKGISQESLSKQCHTTWEVIESWMRDEVTPPASIREMMLALANIPMTAWTQHAKQPCRRRQHVDVTGQTFSHVTVIEYTGGRDETGSPEWKCLCACGNYTILSSRKLKQWSKKDLAKGLGPNCGCKRVRGAGQTQIKVVEVCSSVEKTSETVESNKGLDAVT